MPIQHIPVLTNQRALTLAKLVYVEGTPAAVKRAHKTTVLEPLDLITKAARAYGYNDMPQLIANIRAAEKEMAAATVDIRALGLVTGNDQGDAADLDDTPEPDPAPEQPAPQPIDEDDETSVAEQERQAVLDLTREAADYTHDAHVTQALINLATAVERAKRNDAKRADLEQCIAHLEQQLTAARSELDDLHAAMTGEDQ